MEYTKIKKDINGNPRYVFPFNAIAKTYSEALKIAKGLGGKKYNTKAFPVCIVFQSHNIGELKRDLDKIKNLNV